MADLEQQAQTELTKFYTAYPPPYVPSNVSTGVCIFASMPAYETGPASGLFTVTRPAASTSSLTVNYTIGGTAVNGTDYTTLSGSVVIPANQASAQIVVAPIQHALGGNKTVLLTLSSSTNYTINSNYSADTVTIYDYGNGITSNTGQTKNTSLVAINQPPQVRLGDLFSSQFFLGSSPHFMNINPSALFALMIGQTSPPPLPQLGSSTFFTDVKNRLAATGGKMFYEKQNLLLSSAEVPVNVFVFSADNYHLSTYATTAVGNVINQAVADNPSAALIINGAQCNYHCTNTSLAKLWRNTSNAEPFQTIGVVIHGGSVLSTSSNSSKGSWATAILRYWFGQSTAANNGQALSYQFGQGTPSASATPEAIGGLTSFIYPHGHAQTPTTDHDLGVYASFDKGLFMGFNVIGVNRATGMIIVLTKDNYLGSNLMDMQAPLLSSGVDYALVTDGGGSVGVWSSYTQSYLSKGHRQVPPVDANNTVTSYIIFTPN